MIKIKAAIFDMDGLLIDSEPLWQEAEIETFKDVGVFLTKEMAKKTMGLRLDEVVEYWFSRSPWKKPTKKEIEIKIVERVIELIGRKGTLKNGVIKTLDFFTVKNIPMAIASSSQTDIINAVLDKTSIGKYFKIVHSAQNEKYGKPHPGVYITAAEKIDIDPKHCLAFEDSPNGVLAAKAAKMKCVVVPDQIIKTDNRFSIADKIIDSLNDFSLEILENL